MFLLIYLSTNNSTNLIDINVFTAVFFDSPKFKNNVLEFTVYETGTANFVHSLKLRYNYEYKKVQLIGYDCSCTTISGRGYCNKSYNLLTGKYNVINGFYDKTKTEVFEGIKKQSKIIFIDQFRDELFTELSQIGKEFEKE